VAQSRAVAGRMRIVVVLWLSLALCLTGAVSAPGLSAVPHAAPLTEALPAHVQIASPGVGLTAEASPSLSGGGPTGYSPAQVRRYLGLTGTGAGQTIAVVTAYDAPNAAKDLEVFNATFGLPAPPSFRKVNQSGGTKMPPVSSAWALEAAMDVQWAHAVAPSAAILLVQANTSSLSNLLTAVIWAAKQTGVTVISGSWGAPEYSKQTAQDYRCRLTTGVCVFASGNNGNPATYPAHNPWALAVGGTSLELTAEGTVVSETAWSSSGGGVSLYAPKPAYQSAVAAPRRAVPDVAYAADPQRGFPVYSSTAHLGQVGWFQMGGTSVAAPQWAGILAASNELRRKLGKRPLVADGGNGTTPLHSRLYGSGGPLFDVVSGANGTCGSVCQAGPGYDMVTGVGSPRTGLDVFLRDGP
jgi:subtilase family serine protease